MQNYSATQKAFFVAKIATHFFDLIRALYSMHNNFKDELTDITIIYYLRINKL